LRFDNAWACERASITPRVNEFDRETKSDRSPERICGHRTIAFLLKELRERAVKVGGSVLFTNIAEENPFRVWMEALADWRLIHRGSGHQAHRRSSRLRPSRLAHPEGQDGADTPDRDRK